MGAASLVLSLPAFAVSVFVIYWSLPICAAFNQIKVLKILGWRRDNYGWATLLCRFFRVRFRSCTKEGLYRDGLCIYLCNHRSWADFFVDTYLTEGRGQLLSRMLVLFIFPMFMIPVHILKGVVLFKRGRVVDKEKFNAWMDKQISNSPCAGLVVFPEGHRNIKPESLPLKRGMLNYAFSRQTPVQVIISSGKDQLLSEKKVSVRLGAVITTAYSPVIRPTDFPDFDAFFTRVTEVWLDLWRQAHAPQPAGKLIVPQFDEPQLPKYHYPMDMRIKLLLFACVAYVLFAGALWVSARPYVWLLRVSGPLGPLTVAAYVAASFVKAGMLG